MSQEYGTRITASGAALIAACLLAGEKLPVAEAAAGDGGGGYYLPELQQTTLRGERWRGDITAAERNSEVPNMIDVTIVLPPEAGGFIIRELGLFSSEGVLVAVCNTPDTEKVPVSTGIAGRLTMVMHLLVEDASVLEFIVNSTLDGPSRQDLKDALAAHDADPLAHPALRQSVGGLDARLSLLELLYATDVSGNPFTVTFGDMSGLDVTGVWNEPMKRVEF